MNSLTSKLREEKIHLDVFLMVIIVALDVYTLHLSEQYFQLQSNLAMFISIKLW